MNYIVVAYYTKSTIYVEKVKTLTRSMEKYNIPYDVTAIENKGDWYKNTCYKPTFLKEMLCKHYPKSIVYVDVDAEFMRYPVLFDTFDSDIGVYVFDRSCYKKSAHGFEVLSGTIFLKNNDRVYDIIERWETECQANPRVWDQKSFQKVLGGPQGDFTLLPAEYCTIWDTMDYIINPVIIHYQASREVRKSGLQLRKEC